MTVFVDNFRAPAKVGRINARWSHLTANTPEELHEFAARIGHRREWFQGRCKAPTCPTLDGVCVHFHYDVVDRRRTEAIALGAVPIDLRQMGALMSLRRRQFTTEPGLDMPEPCQPIGCDNEMHLPGCIYDVPDGPDWENGDDDPADGPTRNTSPNPQAGQSPPGDKARP